MVRSLSLLAASMLVAQQQVTAFSVVSSTPRTTLSTSTTTLFSEEESSVERGVSVDQDGKSNVWAIEPKMEVSEKSSEETTQSAVIAGVGLGVAAVAAVAILANLPDPNQF